jgi:hypothetical protein
MSITNEQLVERRIKLTQDIDTIREDLMKLDDLRQQSLESLQLLSGALQMIDELLTISETVTSNSTG